MIAETIMLAGMLMMAFYLLNDLRRTRVYQCDCSVKEKELVQESSLHEARSSEAPYCPWCAQPMRFENNLLQSRSKRIHAFFSESKLTLDTLRGKDVAESRYQDGEIDESQLEEEVESRERQRLEEAESR